MKADRDFTIEGSFESNIKDFVKPFELEKLPAIRIRVVGQSDRTLILADMHHIVCDRGTVSKMLAELIALYQGKALAPVEWQYKDYSEWFNRKDMAAQKDFWLREFEDEIPKLSLAHKTKATSRSDSGAQMKFAISDELKEKVHYFAASHRVTDYMVMLAAFMILLQKYSGQEDVVVGTPISTRTHRNTEAILGMFANTIALRGRPERNKTVAEFVNEIKENALEAYQNKEYSLDDLTDELSRVSGRTVSSLFDVMFVMQDSEDQFNRIEKYGLKERMVSKGTASFDLVFNIMGHSDNGYGLFIEYATDWFDDSYGKTRRS